MTELHRTARTAARTHPERASRELETVCAIIDEALCCHVATSVDGSPRMAPMVHGRSGQRLILHGSRSSTVMRALGAGAEACVAFTLIDGLVVGRSAMNHSLNYRSAIVFGRGAEIVDCAEKVEALRALTERVVPGRWSEVRALRESEVHATLVVGLALDEASAKIRSGPPLDAAADLDGPWWAGVVPLALGPLAPIAAPDLPAGIEPPASVRALGQRPRRLG